MYGHVKVVDVLLTLGVDIEAMNTVRMIIKITSQLIIECQLCYIVTVYIIIIGFEKRDIFVQ